MHRVRQTTYIHTYRTSLLCKKSFFTQKTGPIVLNQKPLYWPLSAVHQWSSLKLEIIISKTPGFFLLTSYLVSYNSK